jgi:outer membrane protein assembly factor BamE
MRKFLTQTVCAASLLLAGCASDESSLVHRIDVQQGNQVTQELVDQLKIGMSERQVIAHMGTPLIRDPFRPERWVYHYSLKPGRGPLEKRQVILWFEGGNLDRIEGDLQPNPEAAPTKPVVETVTVNPPEQKPSLFKRALEGIGVGDN